MEANTAPDSVNPVADVALIYGSTVTAAAPEDAAENVQARGAVDQVEPNVTAHAVVAEAPIVIFPAWSLPVMLPFVPVPQAPDAIDGVSPVSA